MNVKAEAYQEYNQAAVIDKLITGMPEIVRALAAPLANVDKITIVSTGNGDAAGMNKITGDMAKHGGAGAGACSKRCRGCRCPNCCRRSAGSATRRRSRIPANNTEFCCRRRQVISKGGAMALLERVSALIRANLNDLIDRAEDPQKMLKQVILDMQNQMLQVKTQVAIAIADEHLLRKKQKENEDKHAEWMRKAELAVDKKQEDLARGSSRKGCRVSRPGG